VELNKDPTLFVKTIFPIESKETVPDDLHKDDKFPRTKLLLSALQMVDEGYPIPMQGDLHSRFNQIIPKARGILTVVVYYWRLFPSGARAG